MKHIIINRADGGVTHLQIIPQDINGDGVINYADTALEVAAWEQANTIYQDSECTIVAGYQPMRAVSFEEVSPEALPKDREFRAAWKHCPEHGVRVCLQTARSIHMDKIRAARNKELEKLDIQTMRGIDVQARKQILRDLPANFDLSGAKNTDELKALWPEELKQTNTNGATK